ncbi:MAG: hypothetical protein IJD38_08295 [Clostridia bacterium]|nr:hypothetical protein [Clostridia bacterium]
MSQKTKERIHLVYGIILSVLILTVGVCFALSCLSIYRSGSSPFTKESISVHFHRIAIPVYICIAGVIGGGILSLALPVTEGKVRSRRHPEDALEKLSARLDLSSCDEDTATAIRDERIRRRRVTAIFGFLAGITLIPALIWCVNPAHFSIENLNTDIKTAAALVLPCTAVALGLWVATVLLRGASISRETAAVKAALASGKGKTPEKSVPEQRKLTADPRFLWGVRGLILAVGVLFIVLGILNGGMADVLGKAIRICTECIGLG